MIEFTHVKKSFGNKKILDDISFQVMPGEILFILGKSGMGKSVTLKHLVGLLKPDSGQVWVDGKNVPTLSETELAKTRLECGMVFQHPALLDSLTIYENIAFGLRTPHFIRLHGVLKESEIKQTVLKKMDQVHLPAKLCDCFPPEISYGMQKRVSLARTLAPKPKVLLFDEPTTGLDPITTNTINDLIQELSQELQVTSIVVSHDMGCALKIADRILVLDQGKILALDTVDKIKVHPDPLIQDFLSEILEQEEFL
ncbi:MAG: ABC transporter ATP-binding protein [Bdellovibrionaceae bacterium]|nr:ABC transporter ATP-binding protein [Pseudobdellovibrionaceae bacterium]